jgi:hypothetical protein
MSVHRLFRYFSDAGRGASILWTNMPWHAEPPEKVDVSRTGYLEPDEPDEPAEVLDYQACVRGAGDGVTTCLLVDPRKATAEDFEKFIRGWKQQCQLVAWWWGGYASVPRVVQPQSSALVLDAHDAVQENAPDIRRQVAAPFRGLDLKQMQVDATHLKYVRKMKVTTGILTTSLDRTDAWEAQGLMQRLRPIYEDAWPVVSKLEHLAAPLEPLRKLFAGAAELAVETKAKIAAALGRHPGTAAGPQGGPPAGGVPGSGESGAPSGGTPAPGTGPGSAPATPGHKKP